MLDIAQVVDSSSVCVEVTRGQILLGAANRLCCDRR